MKMNDDLQVKNHDEWTQPQVKLELFWENNLSASFSTCWLCLHVSMSLSDCKYGSNTKTDHSYSFHSLPMAENYGKRPVRTFFDFRHKNLPENVDVKWAPLLSLTNLRSISKVKVVSFLLGLTLTFLILASYILTWDKKGLLFTPSPYQLRHLAIPTSTAEADVTSEKNLIDMRLLVKIIGSKLEYTSRKMPDEKDIIGTDSHVSQRKCVWTGVCSPISHTHKYIVDQIT